MDGETEKWQVTTDHQPLFIALNIFNPYSSTLNIPFYFLKSTLFWWNPANAIIISQNFYIFLINSSFRKLNNINKIYHFHDL